VGLAGAIFTTALAADGDVVHAVTTSFAAAIGVAGVGALTAAIRG